MPLPAGRSLLTLNALTLDRREPVRDVGGGIRVASVTDLSGNVVGIIENPHFTLPDSPGS